MFSPRYQARPGPLIPISRMILNSDGVQDVSYSVLSYGKPKTWAIGKFLDRQTIGSPSEMPASATRHVVASSSSDLLASINTMVCACQPGPAYSYIHGSGLLLRIVALDCCSGLLLWIVAPDCCSGLLLWIVALDCCSGLVWLYLT
jgi:hypothetical protein